MFAAQESEASNRGDRVKEVERSFEDLIIFEGMVLMMGGVRGGSFGKCENTA